MTFLKGSFFVFFLNLRSTYKHFFFQLEVRAYSKSFKNVIVFWTEFCSLPLFRKKIYMLDEKFQQNSSKFCHFWKSPQKICFVSVFHFLLTLFFFRKYLSMLARNEKTNSKHKFFLDFKNMTKFWSISLEHKLLFTEYS